MDKKPKAKQRTAEDPLDQNGKARASRKMLLVAVALCLVSLGGGFFLARLAYVQDAEAFAPDYKAGADAMSDTKHGDKNAKTENPKLRDDVKDPLAKDGHDAEKAMSLQAKNKKNGKEKMDEVVDSGLLDFGDIMTNIQSFNAQGEPTTVFLKVSLMVAYRPDEGSGEVMEERKPFMRDLFNGYLRGLSESDVRGMAGILYIKAELLKRARAAVGNDLPQEVLISDLIVQ